jgi:hypothetical protein
VSGFGEPAIADINVVAHQGADLGDLRGVHCGQGEDESRGWGGSCATERSIWSASYRGE